MTVKQIHKIKGDQLIIDLPESLRSSGKEVLVTIEDTTTIHEKKIALMKKAAKDPIFLKDLEEIKSDFESIDFE
ncbi:hypothetical protein [Algoriphagus boritolerans]|uniref:Uncharacterized protein n=1 Tax=Algoriphagus boritolerans DSM 17298 = JCM 18970 TaxID=1120964 RepID=A0A1H6ALK9_9BACT|nr:hypothetical protein [Algoriphagus boritolerans]SEG49262.1 hypothetical protein SAMN03080598_04197 [Algoriphagus boritolerans DSM 17298 = JCM 18970]